MIVKHLGDFYQNWIDSIEDEEIKRIVLDKTFVTGGAIVSLLLNEDVNDYDVYFTDKESCEKVVEYYLSKIGLEKDKNYFFGINDYEYDEEGNIIEIPKEDIKEDDERVFVKIPSSGYFKTNYYNSKYTVLFVSSNAMTLTNSVQLVFRFVGDPEVIHENYDFEHTKCYYIPNKKELVLPQSSLLSILTKELVYNGSRYPMASVIRTRKFIERGWKINAGQYLKMMLQINELNLKNLQVLTDQLMGVDTLYFQAIINRIKEDEAIDEDNISFEIVTKLIDEVFNQHQELVPNVKEIVGDKTDGDSSNEDVDTN